LDTLEEPWQEISIDIIRPLPQSHEQDIIVVIVDWFTKMIQLKVTKTTVLSQEIAKIYWNEIWKLHRILRKILSNRELQFALKFMKKLLKALRTKKTLSIAYHHQTDRQIKRMNQEIEAFLQYYVNYQQDDWME